MEYTIKKEPIHIEISKDMLKSTDDNSISIRQIVSDLLSKKYEIINKDSIKSSILNNTNPDELGYYIQQPIVFEFNGKTSKLNYKTCLVTSLHIPKNKNENPYMAYSLEFLKPSEPLLQKILRNMHKPIDFIKKK